jgi:hypothetical protein
MSTNLFKKVDSGDYISYKRRATIAGEFAKTTNTNPVKRNGNQYNQNFTFLSTFNTPTTDNSNCLIHTQSYELKQNYTNGLKYLHLICDASGNK